MSGTSATGHRTADIRATRAATTDAPAKTLTGKQDDALLAVLNRFTEDVTEKARSGRIDPVFGRDTEIRQMVDILSRRRKNNPILVGEPGWAKPRWWKGWRCVSPKATCRTA
ncbi:hypothetical protein ECZU43_42730 [Escherichia coli]|nr:hypothetical protein ECZU43_42730 [Escherichia coli]